MNDTELSDRLIAFMREADEWGTPADVLRSAEDAGLHIVSEADKRVLDAMAEIPEESMGWAQAISHSLDAALDAELARRKP